MVKAKKTKKRVTIMLEIEHEGTTTVAELSNKTDWAECFSAYWGCGVKVIQAQANLIAQEKRE